MPTKTCLRTVTLMLGAIWSLTGIPLGAAAETIKVGILHSLSGTMAISETTLKDTMLMLIEAQNEAGAYGSHHAHGHRHG